MPSVDDVTQQYSHVKRPLNDLRTTGLLWLINTALLHPRGYALALHYADDSNEVIGWSLVGDGTEDWEFKNGSSHDQFAAVQELLRPANQVPVLEDDSAEVRAQEHAADLLDDAEAAVQERSSAVRELTQGSQWEGTYDD